MDQARGDVLVIQDADLELDPRDIISLLEPILKGQAEVCYGSRFLRRNPALCRLPTYWANRALNLLSNLVNGIRITDFNTCYKMFTARLSNRLDLTSRGFSMEAEITAKLARLGMNICERPVRYEPRSRAEGKKIRARDLIDYVRAMLRFRLAAMPTAPEPGRAANTTPVAVTARPPEIEWHVIGELREAWEGLWQPARHCPTPRSMEHLGEAPRSHALMSESEQRTSPPCP
jgi:hypothetical protein